MKRKRSFVWSVLLVLLIIAAAVLVLRYFKRSEAPHEHTDSNGDYRCDDCGEILEHEHTDKKDGDGMCDICGERLPPHEHTDSDGDYRCDDCGEILEHEHTDQKDGDGMCDICGEHMPDPPIHKEPSIRFEDGEEDIVFSNDPIPTKPTVALDKQRLIFPTTESCTLNATIRGESNGVLDWTVMWVDPSSEWANGKDVTDYITLSASTTAATVHFQKDFGEQIKILCSLI